MTTVRELIAQLSHFPGEMRVLVEAREPEAGDFTTPDLPKRVQVVPLGPQFPREYFKGEPGEQAVVLASG